MKKKSATVSPFRDGVGVGVGRPTVGPTGVGMRTGDEEDGTPGKAGRDDGGSASRATARFVSSESQNISTPGVRDEPRPTAALPRRNGEVAFDIHRPPPIGAGAGQQTQHRPPLVLPGQGRPQRRLDGDGRWAARTRHLPALRRGVRVHRARLARRRSEGQQADEQAEASSHEVERRGPRSHDSSRRAFPRCEVKLPLEVLLRLEQRVVRLVVREELKHRWGQAHESAHRVPGAEHRDGVLRRQPPGEQVTHRRLHRLGRQDRDRSLARILGRQDHVRERLDVLPVQTEVGLPYVGDDAERLIVGRVLPDSLGDLLHLGQRDVPPEPLDNEPLLGKDDVVDHKSLACTSEKRRIEANGLMGYRRLDHREPMAALDGTATTRLHRIREGTPLESRPGRRRSLRT